MNLGEIYGFEEDKMGMTVTSGRITIIKDTQNQIGISISGGAPYCPCIYVVQIFENTPADSEGSLKAGDEITSVNGISVKGKTKSEVARLFQTGSREVIICYNKLHADVKQGKTLDIILKKIKHKVVENLDTSTADALGLSRAILVNDDLVKKCEQLHLTSELFHGMITHLKYLLRALFNLSRVYKGFSDTFYVIGAKESNHRANEAFTKFAVIHREIENFSVDMLKTIKPEKKGSLQGTKYSILSVYRTENCYEFELPLSKSEMKSSKPVPRMIGDLNTFVTKVIPDMNMTMKKYLDVKFEYLSYCLKVKEMDEEEYSYAILQEPLYRVETGNYEYRLVLRCRQEARVRFAAMRKDILVKIDLLDNKHVQDVVTQLKRFVDAMSEYHNKCLISMKDAVIFPIEMDLTANAFAYPDGKFNTGYSDEYQQQQGDNSHTDFFNQEDDESQALAKAPKSDLVDIFGDPMPESASKELALLSLDDGTTSKQIVPGNADIFNLLN